MIGDPLLVAAAHETVMEFPLEAPVGLPGTSGVLAGITADDAGENCPVPCSEIAATRKV